MSKKEEQKAKAILDNYNSKDLLEALSEDKVEEDIKEVIEEEKVANTPFEEVKTPAKTVEVIAKVEVEVQDNSSVMLLPTEWARQEKIDVMSYLYYDESIGVCTIEQFKEIKL